MAQNLKHVLCLLLTLASLCAIKAIEFDVSNNAGSSIGAARFDKEFGVDNAKQTLNSAANFIQRLFQHNNNNADINSVPMVHMVVENIDGVTFTSNNVIHVSAAYIEKYPENVNKEISGLLYHAMAHVLLWDGNGTAPSGLVEGMADFVRLKGGYAPDYWNPPGVGYNWDEGYEVTAQFLNYCDSVNNGFVADLNEKMKNGYNESYFNELLGMPVTQLWSDYMAMYGNKNN